MKKSFISVLLSCALVFSSLTVPVFADTVDETIVVDEVVEDEAAEEVTVDEAAVEEVAVEEEAVVETAVEEETAEEVGQWKAEISDNEVAQAQIHKDKYIADASYPYYAGLALNKSLYGTTVLYNAKKKAVVKATNKLAANEYVDYGNTYSRLLKKKEYTVSYNIADVELVNSKGEYTDVTAKKADYITEKNGKFTIPKGLSLSGNSVYVQVEAFYTLKNGKAPVASDTNYIIIRTQDAEFDSLELVPDADGVKLGLKTISDNKAEISANMVKYYNLVVKKDGKAISGNDLYALTVTGTKAFGIDDKSYDYVNLKNTGLYGKSKITVKGKKSKKSITVKTTLPELGLVDLDDDFEDKDVEVVNYNRFIKTTASCNVVAGSYATIAAKDRQTCTTYKVKLKAKGAKLVASSKYSKYKYDYNYLYYPTKAESTVKIVPTKAEYKITNSKYFKAPKVKLAKKVIEITMPSENAAKVSLNGIVLKSELKDAKYACVEMDGAAWTKAYKKALKSKNFNDQKKRDLYNGYKSLGYVLADTDLGYAEVKSTAVNFSEITIDDYKTTESAKHINNIADVTPFVVGSYKAKVVFYNANDIAIGYAPITIKVKEAATAKK